MLSTPTRDLDPTPPRPTTSIRPPGAVLRMSVDVDVAHLANPLVAVSRLLGSEAGALVHVEGDEDRFMITLALDDRAPSTLDHAETWIRWAVHNAGIRGRLHRVG